MAFTTEDAKAVAIVAAGVGGIATVAYFVYSLANPGPKGGSCITPGTPCYSALQAYLQEFNTCATQYSQLMQQLMTSGQAPTAAQSQILSELRNCMDAAAKNLATTAAQYVPDTWSTLISQLLWEGLVIALTYLGLQTLLNYLKGRISGGQLTTLPENGVGIAALVYDGFVQFGVQNNLITSAQATVWESAVTGFTNDQIAEVNSYFNTLVFSGLLTATDAAAAISAESADLIRDAGTTIAVLRALPMTAYEAADCGCQ